MDSPLVNLIVAAVGAVFGYLLKYNLDKRGEAESRRFTDKREHYRNLILTIKNLTDDEKQAKNAQDIFWFEYSFLWLYAPDTVLRSANTVARILKESSSPTADLKDSALGELLLEMRRGIGFKASEMTSLDYLARGSTEHRGTG